MKKKFIIISLVLAFVISTLFLLNNFKANEVSKSQETFSLHTVSEYSVNNSILVPGIVLDSNKDNYYLDPELGSNYNIQVKDGDSVKKGDLLYKYNNNELTIELQKIELQLEATQLEYTDLINKKKSLEKKMNHNISNLEKTQLQDDLSSINLQIKIKNINLQDIKLTKESLNQKLKKLNVYSKSDGKVIYIRDSNEYSENYTAINAPLISIENNNTYVVQGNLTELQRSQVTNGIEFTMTAKAVPDEEWSGYINQIKNSPIETDITDQGINDTSLSTYTFTGILNNQQNLLPGYHVSLELKLTPIKTLMIPKTAIYETIDKKQFVLVVRKGKLIKESIKTGVEKENLIEIFSSIKVGDMIVEEASSEIKEGMEVEKSL